MKKLWLLITLILAGSAFAAWWWLSSESNFHYIERTSAIVFPEKTKILSEYDSGDGILIMVLHIPNEEVSGFLSRYRFVSPGAKTYTDFFAKNLSYNFRMSKEERRNYAMKGRNKTNTWHFVLNVESSELWCLVGYADMAGDPP